MSFTIDKSKIDPKLKKTQPVKKVTPPAQKLAKTDYSSGGKASKERSIKMVGKPTGDMDAETYKVKKPKRQYYKAANPRKRKATPKELERYKKQAAKADAKEKAKMYKSPETGRMTRRTKSLRDTSIGIADRRIKVAAQKTKQMAAKGAQAAVAKIRVKPFPTTFGAVVIAGTVRDMFRGMPKIPAPPKVKGGTVGRRTAG